MPSGPVDGNKAADFMSLETHPDIWFGLPYVNNNKKVCAVVAPLATPEVVWQERTQTHNPYKQRVRRFSALGYVGVHRHVHGCILRFGVFVEYENRREKS